MIHLKRENNTLLATIGNVTRSATLRSDNRWVFTQGDRFNIGNGKTNFSVTITDLDGVDEKVIAIADFIAKTKTKSANGKTAKPKTSNHEKTVVNLQSAIDCVKSTNEKIASKTATITDLQRLKAVYTDLLPKYAPQNMADWVSKANDLDAKIADLKKAEEEKRQAEKAVEEKMIADLLRLL